MTNDHIESRLYFFKNAIDTVRNNPSIKAKLHGFGYDDKKIDSGLTLWDSANSFHHQQIIEYDEQYQATREVGQARKTARKTYSIHVKVARVAFNDNPSAFKILQLDGQRERTDTGFIEEAMNFYDDSLNQKNIVKGFAEYGFTADKLEEGRKLVRDFKRKRNQQLKEMTEAREHTELRDKRVDTFEDWAASFYAISRIALEDAPEELQGYGIGVIDR
jgi:hypothetical protein